MASIAAKTQIAYLAPVSTTRAHSAQVWIRVSSVQASCARWTHLVPTLRISSVCHRPVWASSACHVVTKLSLIVIVTCVVKTLTVLVILVLLGLVSSVIIRLRATIVEEVIVYLIRIAYPLPVLMELVWLLILVQDFWRLVWLDVVRVLIVCRRIVLRECVRLCVSRIRLETLLWSNVREKGAYGIVIVIQELVMPISNARCVQNIKDLKEINVH